MSLFGRRKRTITRLLIVEDEPLIAFDTEHFLTDADYEIVGTVDRVADAMAKLDDGAEIDLVLVDISLADGNGADVARAARERGVPVMFVTGDCPDDAAEIAHGFLAKPYPQRSLLLAIQAVEAAIEGRAPKRLPPGFSLFDRSVAS